MRFRALVGAVVILGLCGSVWADWWPEQGHKMHYPQLPDLDNGMNINATEPKLLADDWRCSGTGWVTDIHIWGSWLWDEWPVVPGTQQMAAPNMDLYIFKDIPAVVAANGDILEHSRPGDVVWSRHFLPHEIVIGEQISNYEPFYCPNLGQVIGYDNNVIQYNFFLDPTEAFFQEKDTIYWLGVQKRILTPEDNQLFGWKTSADHWNDDAVFTDYLPQLTPGMDPPGPFLEWYELIDPRTGESMDLSFVITGVVPEPGTSMLAILGVGTLMAWRRRRRK